MWFPAFFVQIAVSQQEPWNDTRSWAIHITPFITHQWILFSIAYSRGEKASGGH